MTMIPSLSAKAEEFIKYRRASMNWNDICNGVFHKFIDYCLERSPNSDTLTDDIVSEWCEIRPTENRNSCRARIYPIVGFVRFLNFRYSADLAEVSVPKRERRKYIPHAFTAAELSRFFRACDTTEIVGLHPKRDKLIQSVIFRLMYSTGLRPIEARSLKRTDVNLESGVIGVTTSKGYDQHYVVMHDSMLNIVRQYDKLMADICPERTYFFPWQNDGCVPSHWLNKQFRFLRDTQSIPYDFRHNYAIQNINSWMSVGLNYHAKLVSLSKSMGHRDIEHTKYYYSLVPMMSDILEKQTASSFDELIPEVQYEESV